MAKKKEDSVTKSGLGMKAIFDEIEKEGDLTMAYLNNSIYGVSDGFINTGCLSLNAIISGSLYGGIPKGRTTLFAGESAVGKSYFCTQAIVNAQKDGMYVLLADSEGAYTKESLINSGVDPNMLMYFRPANIEECRNKLYKIFQRIRGNPEEYGKLFVVVDSIAGMMSELQQTRIDDDNNAMDMGTVARVVATLLNTCNVVGGLVKATCLFTNHIYDNPNERYPSLIKNMKGGKACRYIPSVVVQLAKLERKSSDYTNDEDETTLSKGVDGVEIRAMCVKNRYLRPLIEASMYLGWKTGLDEEYGTVELAEGLNILKKTGSRYVFNDGSEEGVKLGYAKTFRKDKELWAEKIYPQIESKLLAEWGYKGAALVAPEVNIDIDEIEDEDDGSPSLDF